MNQVEDFAKEILAQFSEELHPDLVPYFEPDGAIGAQLRHPLVYQIPFFNNGMANKSYKYKQNALSQAIAEKNFSEVIYLHERPYRLEAFSKIADDLLDTQYWRLLSSIWIDTENQWQNLGKWKELLSSNRSSRHYLMDEDDDRLISLLPEEVTIYRGCQKGINENGLSWTLDKSKAKFFAERFSKKGIILEKRISKKEIVAVFTGRGESEVIFLDRG